jgi:CheY-specific phosphatase CheX
VNLEKLIESDHEKYRGIFKFAIAEVFENLIFTEPEFDDNAEVEQGQFIYIDLLDPLEARLYGRVSAALASDIASTVLSIEAEHLSDVILNDAVGEVLNTVAGTFFRNVLADGEKFNLGLPGKTESPVFLQSIGLHVSAKINDESVSFHLVPVE